MNCPNCNTSLQDYFDTSSSFTEHVCWKCGHYESNSPAYLSNPDGFKNIVRENPSILRHIITRSTDNLHGKNQSQNGQNRKTITL